MDVAITASRGRTIAFRIVAGILGFLAFVPSVIFVLGSFADETQDLHLVHNIAGLASFGFVFGAAGWVLARHPNDSAAAFRAVAFGSVAALAGGFMSGDVVSGFWWVGGVFALVLYALHPDRAEATRLGSTSVALLLLGLVGLATATAFALHQADLQRNGIPALDPHAEFHHYSGMAVYGLVTASAALAAATSGGGARLMGWAAGLGAIAYAAAAVAYRDHVGAVGPAWAVATIAWGVAVVAVTELEAHRSDLRRGARA